MKCRECGYELWNLREPRCPECARGFDVEEWEFEAGTVTFHCHACHARLPHRKPGFGSARCGQCDAFIDWSAVMVVPKGERTDGIAERKRSWEGIPPVPAAAAALALVICSGFFIGGIGGRSSPPNVELYILSLLVGLALAGVGVLLAPRRERRKAIVVFGVVWLALGSFKGWECWSQLHRYREWRWCSAQQSALRLIAHGSATYVAEWRGAVQTHPLALMDYVGPQMFVTPEWGTDPATVTIGTQTLQDWIDGRGSHEELQAQIQRDFDGEVGEWVRVGDYSLSRCVRAWDVTHPDVVVVVGPPHPTTGARSVLYSDGHVWWLKPGSEMDAQNALRESLGMEPLPSN